MSEELWWRPYLLSWSEAVGVSFTVGSYTNPHRGRHLGDWWRDRDQWKVHLDDSHYAVVEATQQLDDRLRKSLSWTLGVLQREAQPPWRQALLQVFDDCLALQPDELLRNLSVSRSLVLAAGAPREPGYLVWLNFTPPTSTRHGAGQEDWQAGANQILEAVIPGGLIGWLLASDGSPSAVVYYPLQLLADDANEGPSADGDSHSRAETEVGASLRVDDDLRWLRQVFTDLILNLELDAYVRAEVAIGCRVNGPADLADGVVSVVSAWHMRGWKALANDNISIWGERPILTLLQAASDPVVDWFLRAAERNTPQPGLRLPADLLQALDGVMVANLNVSEAARMLYLHRNTLLHRIERIRQLTGYDIRNFEDALTLWLMHLLDRKD